MLFKARFHDGLRTGAIDLSFRRWARPQVKPGGRYRVGADLELAVSDVRRVGVEEISAAEARRAGFEDLEELRDQLAGDESGSVYRIAFAARSAAPQAIPSSELDAGELPELLARLGAMDRRARSGPWVAQTLRLVAEHPRRRAGDLAELVGRELRVFKTDVRKLKRLGLTRSFEVGYELTRRGHQALSRLEDPGPKGDA